MTSWIDMAGIVFACTAANHLGLVPAVEERIGRSIPIVNCPKCFSFWATLAYCIATGFAAPTLATVGGGFAAVIGFAPVIHALAISFLAAWLAVWLELFMGIIDKFYIYIYEKIYPNSDNDDAHSADADTQHPDLSLPGVR